MSDEEKPTLTHLTARFTQEGNTLGTTEEYETLHISLEWQDPEDAPFIVLQTGGWSIDDLSCLQPLVDQIRPKLPQATETTQL